MIAEFTSLSFRDRAFMVALATIGERIRELAKDDQADLRELTKEFLTTDGEEQESAARAILEVFEDRTPVRLSEMKLPQGTGVAENYAKFVGKKIRDLRLKAGLTQEQLAERSELSNQSYISRIESGLHAPNALTIEKIAKGLGVEISAVDFNSPESE
jgi:DNA-binding XRE family transcriptional regulator